MQGCLATPSPPASCLSLGGSRKPICQRPRLIRFQGRSSRAMVMELLAQKATASPCKITVYSSHIN